MPRTAAITTTKRILLTAKCAANQPALDRLAVQRERYGQSKFSFTLKRAMESIAKAKTPISTTEQAVALPYVGPHIAKIIVGSEDKPKKRKRNTAKNKENEGEAVNKSTSTPVSKRTPNKRIRQPPPPIVPTVTAHAAETPSARALAYQKAVATANDWRKIPQQLIWRVLLLIDNRERQANHMQAKCQMSGIPTEERQLPIGDMMWIAQGYARRPEDDESKPSTVLQAEVLLGTIIERKTMDDLKSSLFGTRYAEQRLRLANVGCPQVLFVVEGDPHKNLYRCPADTLNSAVWETRLHRGFSAVYTQHMDDTVRTLKRMHRRILQRSFPDVYRDEALPTFAEVGLHRRPVGPSPPQLNPRQRRKRRKQRIESLMEMSFDVDPRPPLGTASFVSYKQVKSKVEWDRESGRRTVGNVHRAMLKQVTMFSAKKVQAVAAMYPTTSHLLSAYDQVSDQKARKNLVSNISTSDESTRKLTIGPRSSAELYVAYGRLRDDEEEEDDDESSPKRKQAPVSFTSPANTKLVAATLSQQSGNSSTFPPATAHDLTEAEVCSADFWNTDSDNDGRPAESIPKTTASKPATTDPWTCDYDDSDDDRKPAASNPSSRAAKPTVDLWKSDYHNYNDDDDDDNNNIKSSDYSVPLLTTTPKAATTILDFSLDTTMDEDSITPSRFPRNPSPEAPTCSPKEQKKKAKADPPHREVIEID